MNIKETINNYSDEIKNIKSESDKLIPYLKRGDLWVKLGLFDEAIADYQCSIGIIIRETEYKKGDCRFLWELNYKIATCLLILKRYKEAKQYFVLSKEFISFFYKIKTDHSKYFKTKHNYFNEIIKSLDSIVSNNKAINHCFLYEFDFAMIEFNLGVDLCFDNFALSYNFASLNLLREKFSLNFPKSRYEDLIEQSAKNEKECIENFKKEKTKLLIENIIYDFYNCELKKMNSGVFKIQILL